MALATLARGSIKSGGRHSQTGCVFRCKPAFRWLEIPPKAGDMRRLVRSISLLGAAATISFALAGQVLAQADGSWFPFKIPGLTTGSVTPAAPLPPVAPGSSEWSGESGSSGHPLMTADAIREAAGNFHACLEGLWPEAARRGVPRTVFDEQTAALTPDLRIMDLLDAQPEFTKAIWDYLDLLVSDDRIQNGRAILARHRAIFDAVEKAYGVDRHIITAIWGVEFELRHPDRPALGRALDRDACLRRPPTGLFPRGIPVCAGDHRPWRRRSGASSGFLGRRFRAHPIHAHELQEIRRGLRR